MIVHYLVVQENEKGKRKNKLLFTEECTLLYAGMEIHFENKLFQIQYLQPSTKSTNAICYELNKKIQDGKTGLLDQDTDL